MLVKSQNLKHAASLTDANTCYAFWKFIEYSKFEFFVDDGKCTR